MRTSTLLKFNEFCNESLHEEATPDLSKNPKRQDLEKKLIGYSNPKLIRSKGMFDNIPFHSLGWGSFKNGGTGSGISLRSSDQTLEVILDGGTDSFKKLSSLCKKEAPAANLFNSGTGNGLYQIDYSRLDAATVVRLVNAISREFSIT